MKETNKQKFKVGDIVDIVRPSKPTRGLFDDNLKGLEIYGYDGDDYSVYNKDKSDWWYVCEHEMELSKDKINSVQTVPPYIIDVETGKITKVHAEHSFMWAVERMKEGKKVNRKKFPQIISSMFDGYLTTKLNHFDFEATDWEIFEEPKKNTFGLCEVEEDGKWINIDICGENISIADHRYDDLEKAIKRARELGK